MEEAAEAAATAEAVTAANKVRIGSLTYKNCDAILLGVPLLYSRVFATLCKLKQKTLPMTVGSVFILGEIII